MPETRANCYEIRSIDLALHFKRILGEKRVTEIRRLAAEDGVPQEAEARLRFAVALTGALNEPRPHEYGGFPEGTRGYLLCAVCGKLLSAADWTKDNCSGKD